MIVFRGRILERRAGRLNKPLVEKSEIEGSGTDPVRSYAFRPAPMKLAFGDDAAHSITSSTRARMNGGMVRPRAFAVFKLTTSSCTALAPSVIEPPPYTAQVARRSRWDRPAEADSPVEEQGFEPSVPP